MVIVIIGVGFSIAVPSFQGMQERNRLVTQSNSFVAAVSLARSEASRLGSTVTLQAAVGTAGNEFGGGYCIVRGDPGDCDDPVIRRFSALLGSTTTLSGVDDAANNGDWNTPRDAISFNSLGGLAGTSNQLRVVDLCHPDQLDRRIQIGLIGRAKVWREAEAGDPDPPSIQPDC